MEVNDDVKVLDVTDYVDKHPGGTVAPDGFHIGVPPADCYPLETEEEKEERIKKKKKDLKKVELLTPDYALFRLEKLFARQGYYGLPNTDGEWLSNFKAHMKNEHSILSIFFTHEAAPFSRTERAMYLYIVWGMTFFITAAMNSVESDSNESHFDV